MAEYNKTKSHQIRKSDIQEITCLRAAVLPQIRAAAGQMGALSRIVLLCPLPQILWK